MQEKPSKACFRTTRGLDAADAVHRCFFSEGVFRGALDEDDEVFYADSAYSSAEIAENLPENCKNEICEKGYRGHPLTEEQKKENNRKSKTRCRIEHIFGFMTNSMKGITLRCIGFKRAWTQIGLLNLVYNMCRYKILKKACA